MLSLISMPQPSPMSPGGVGNVFEPQVLRGAQAPSFTQTLAGALDGLSMMTARADALGAGIAAGTSSIAQAAIARAKADVWLEVAAVAASRLSSDVSALMQMQI